MVVRRIPNWDGATESAELYHHGILGQRWGRRRYQNNDGSLKTAGYSHYGYGLKKEIGEKASEIQEKLSALNIKENVEDKIEKAKAATNDVKQKITSEKAQKIAKVVLAASAITLTAATIYTLHNNKGIKFHKDLAFKELELQRIQGSPVLNKSHANYYFNKAYKMDKLKYTGTYGATRKLYFKEDPYLVSAVGKNMKMASVKNSSKAFNERYMRDRRFRNAVNEGFDLAKKGDLGKLKADKNLMNRAQKLANKGKLSKHEQMKLYEAFNATLTIPDKNHKQYNKFYKDLKRKGYTGVWDVHDMWISPYRNKGPMIIFDHKRVNQTGARKLKNMELLTSTVSGGAVMGSQRLVKEGAAAAAAASGTIIIIDKEAKKNDRKKITKLAKGNPGN